MNNLNVLAKALYDNVAESPDELSFRKGDILTVLEHNAQGLDGWWLCSLHRRQGIVPGNRLKILVGAHDKKQTALGQGTHQLQLLPPPAPSSYEQPVTCSTQPDSIQYAPTHPAFSAYEEDNIYLVPSKKIEVTDLYQVPHRSQSPPAKNPIQYDKPVPHYLSQRNVQDIYQVPLFLNQAQELYRVPVPANKLAYEDYEVPPSYGIGPDIEQVPLSETDLQGIYHVPQPMDKGNWDKTRPPEKVHNSHPTVMMGHRSRNRSEEIYDVPPSFENLPLQPHLSIYNIPSISKSNSDCSTREDTYDTPPRKQELPLFLHCMYDIPRGAPGGKPLPQDRESKVLDEFTDNINRLSESSTGSTSNISTSLQEIALVKETSVESARPCMLELDLDLDVAMAMLAKLQHNVATSVSHLMSFVSGTWRSSEQMGAHLQDIQTAIVCVQNAVRELLEFAQGAVGNATKAADQTLYTKLSKQFQKMEDVYQTLLKHSQALDSCNWSLSILMTHKPNSGDDLDHFIMYSRGIPDDTKQLASFLRGNASLLFKKTNPKSVHVDFQTGLRNAGELANKNLSIHQTENWEKRNIQSRPLPLPPKFVAGESPDGCSENKTGMMEDYDYVHLQVTGEFDKTEEELLAKGKNKEQSEGELDQEPGKMKECDWLAIGNDHLNSSDKKLLHFYLEQCETNVTTLTNAIDAFFTSVISNQPPRIFVANSKFVILSAHKLVFIGDTLSRQAKAQGIRSEFTHYSNLLCDMLKEIVSATKMAAIQYPSPSAAKDMVDCVKELGRGTHQFQVVLGQLATM